MTTLPTTRFRHRPTGARADVVVGVDGSAAGTAALDWAVDEARTLGRPLTLVHAHTAPVPWPETMGPPPLPAPEEDHVITWALGRLGDDADRLGVTTRTFGGSAAAALVELSAGASTVVVGAPSRGPLGSAVVGSVTVNVAAHASCPVVVVRAGLRPADRERGVVVGADGSEASDAAIGEAFRRADRLGLPLTVVHVWYMEYAGPTMVLGDDELDRRRVGERERALTAEAVAGWSEYYPDVVVTSEVVHGDPVKVLTDASHGAEVVVVGSHGRGEIGGLVLGSVSQGLIRRAESPVMVVRPETRSR